MSGPASRSLLLPAILLSLLAVLVHLPTVNHPWMVDDGVQMIDNPSVARGAPLAAYLLDRNTTSRRHDYNAISYRPLRSLTARGLIVAFGAKPLTFGIANLVLYALLTALVLRLTFALTGSLLAAAWATALWSLLPVHVEAVAYASAISDELSAVLQLGSILCAWPVLRGDGAHGKQLALGAASVLLALLAMLAKEMAITTVAILGAAVVIVPELPRKRAAWTLLAVHGAVALGYLALRTHVVGTLAQVSTDTWTLARGIRKAPLVLLGNLRIILAPLGHRIAYLVPMPSPAAIVLALLAIVGIAALAIGFQRRTGKWTLSFGLAWVLVSLVPVLHLVRISLDLADRFALVPSVGAAIAAAALLATVRPGKPTQLVNLVCGLLAVLYGAATVIESRAWADDRSLWTHAVAEEPDSPLTRLGMGIVLVKDGQPELGLEQLDRAWALGGRVTEVAYWRAIALEALAHPQEAEAAARWALKHDPELAKAHALLGEVLRRQGRFDEALAELAQASRIEPGDASTELLAGAIFEQQRRFDEAARAYRALGDQYPDTPRFPYLLARALLAAGRPAEALPHVRRCRSLAAAGAHPECACLEGRALLAAGTPDGAREALDAGLRGLQDGAERELCRQARAAVGP